MSVVKATSGKSGSTTWLNVRDYRAKGDGSTDDTAAIQAAINAASSAESAVVYFPRGVYRLNTSQTSSGISYCLSLTTDNVTLRGDSSATSILRNTTASAGTILIAGAGKPEGITQWLKYAPWRYTGDTFTNGSPITPAAPNPILTITGGTRGATSVTLATPAQASQLAIGDDIVIRSGQLVVNAGNWNAEPDSEYNVVLDANAGTGVITLERPLCKDYVQEYQSAIGQTSTTTVAAVTCPLGIMKLTGAVQRNVTLTDLRFEVTSSHKSPIFIRGTVDGYTERDIVIDCVTSAHDALEFRNFTFERVYATMRGTNREDMWPITSAVGCSDGLITDVVGIATEKICTLHIHEGSARITARNVTLTSGRQSGASNNEISIRSRAYDVTVENYTIVGSGANTAIYIGSDCPGGGRIGAGMVRKPSAVRSISCQSKNWTIEPPGDGKGGDISIHPTVRSLERGQPFSVMQGWLSDDVQTVTLGKLPANAIIISGGVSVYEVFNSSGTDQVTAGWDGFTNAGFSVVDVATAGAKNGTPVVGYSDVARDLKAYYTAGGSAPTTGKALVWLLVAASPIHVA